MSHVVQIKTQVRDAAAVRAGCSRLRLPSPVEGEFKLFNETARGLAVQLQGWRYPVVFDLTSGESRYDNFAGNWGDQARLDQFLQAYAIEKAKIEARRNGYSVTETPLENGAVKVTVHVGGAA